MVSPTASLRGVAVLPPSDDLSFSRSSSLAFPTVLLPKTDKSLGFGCAPASLAQSVVSVVVGTGLRPQVAQEPFDHRGASSITARNHIHHHSEGI